MHFVLLSLPCPSSNAQIKETDAVLLILVKNSPRPTDFVQFFLLDRAESIPLKSPVLSL